MTGIALYLTHPEVVIDPAVPVPQWGLSARGRARAEAFAAAIAALGIGRIVASIERKAIETAEILGTATGVLPETREGLHENDRSATGFLPRETFEATAERFFSQPDVSVDGWERAIDAQARIARTVRELLAERPEVPTLFVGHGGVGSLLRCYAAGLPISRAQDQPPGGGNWFRFRLAEGFASTWRRMEEPPRRLVASASE